MEMSPGVKTPVQFAEQHMDVAGPLLLTEPFDIGGRQV